MGTVLIASPRQTPADLDLWRAAERADHVRARLPRMESIERRAMDSIRAFRREGPCYAGVSWGKDSVVLAHLVARVRMSIPLVWVRIDPVVNPDCDRVRDAFFERVGSSIDCLEIHERTWLGDDGRRARRKPAGFDEVVRVLGTDRYLSGVRADESGVRGLRMARWGESTGRTCAPIGRWTADDVFAYLARHDLPVHPAYACTGGGAWDRGRIRVGDLMGSRGEGHGRAEWERRYYGDDLIRIRREMGGATP